MSPIEIHFGLSEIEFLVIRVMQRQFPENGDYWEGNWLAVQVEASASAFTARIVHQYIRTEEIMTFGRELIELYNTLEGTAEFSTMEGWLTIQLTDDGIGHITANCELRDGPRMENTLEFRLQFDQTYIPNILKAIEQVAKTFPIVGLSPSRRPIRL